MNNDLTFFEVIDALDKYAVHTSMYCDQEMIGSCVFEQKNSFSGIYIDCQMSYMAPFGCGEYTMCIMHFSIPYFSGKKKLTELDVKPLLDMERIENFVARGHKFTNHTEKPKYCHCNGFMYVMTHQGIKRLPINSRVVVDPNGYKKYLSADRWHNNEIHHVISDEMIMSTLPTVPAYSFEYRAWGEVPVDQLSEIVFDESAYDRTVLPDDYRYTIRNLVMNFYNTSCTDFIAGKKRGLVFLLNGPPGTGKSLTSNAVAELCHRPLYSVGSGDLGTNASSIENQLRKIFEMVEKWNGIVLIDEADVFMSVRTDYDIMYNSCVSVFLRLIESYYGILFLTTNRNNRIDPAFDSRIHIRLRYDELDDEGRTKVWNESLGRYKITNADVSDLCKYKLNNREIANIIQLAYIESGGNSDAVSHQTIQNYINMRLSFDTLFT